MMSGDVVASCLAVLLVLLVVLVVLDATALDPVAMYDEGDE